MQVRHNLFALILSGEQQITHWYGQVDKTIRFRQGFNRRVINLFLMELLRPLILGLYNVTTRVPYPVSGPRCTKD